MKKVLLRVPAAILYLIALGCMAIYFGLSFNPSVFMDPTGRLILLGLSCLAIYFGSLLIVKTIPQDKSKKIMKTTFFLFFMIYILLIATLTLFDRRSRHIMAFKWDSVLLKSYIKYSLNIIPFATIYKYISGLFSHSISAGIVIPNILGNLVAFVPFAFFLPLFSKKMKPFKRFLITMLCIVVSIELLQFLMRTGSCDIDDVILNVGGACAFYRIFHIEPIKRLIEKVTMLKY